MLYAVRSLGVSAGLLGVVIGAGAIGGILGSVLCKWLTSRLGAEPAPEDESLWDREYERRLFAVAIEKVQPEFQETTWKAFWQTAVENREPKAVADGLKMSVGAVYVAKSRVLARLRDEVKVMMDEEDKV